MAVLSKPSLRSSVRKETDQESPAAASDSRKGKKRARHFPPSDESDTSSKKLKRDPQLRPPKSSSQKRVALKSLPFRARPSATGEVTQGVKSRKRDPVHAQAENKLNASLSAPDDTLHQGINQKPPSPPAVQVERRSLRSHDGGSRSKSELAQYFANYDELINIKIKEPDLLTPETILHIVDEASNSAPASQADSEENIIGKGKWSAASTLKDADLLQQSMEWPEEVFTTLHNATRINLSVPDPRQKKSTGDPLDDSFYLKAHARAERKEKQLRNIEKERAMHEKVQLERLLDGLRGHDWLRVMGISGITDGEKKAYEPKRDHLIHEVRALLEKFRLWKEEEKRRKAEKEEEMEEDDEEDDEDRDEVADSDTASHAISDGDPPGYSDADASAARQLRLEASKATGTRRSNKQAKANQTQPSPTPASKELFKSFYAKSYLRAAVIGNHRRSGRSRMAFGQPIPDIGEHEFHLPHDVRTTEAMLESGRRMRKAKREVTE